MKNILYIDVLTALSVYGVGVQGDISYVFDDYETIPETLADAYWATRVSKIIDILDVIKSNNHIDYVNHSASQDNPKWNDPIKIFGTLTFEGLMRLQQFQLNKSILLNNEASLRNYKAQSRGLRSTIIIAGLTLVVSVVNMVLGLINDDRIQDIKTQITKLKSQVELIKKK